MKKQSSLYRVHPGVKMIQDWIKNLPEKTGKSLNEWVDLLEKTGPKDIKEQKAWLKEKYNFGTNAAWWVADYAEGILPWEGDPESYLIAADQYVQSMFSGSKIGLLPLYDKLLEVILNIAPDVKACPCKTIVPIYRNYVFAQIKPTTKTRIDLGLALQKTPFSTRLIDTGGQAKKNRITHRIAITQLADIDSEVIHWLKTAYQLDSHRQS
ncbi:MAG: DUF4287 domain-containing protein [Parachlamydiaceae bacterium]|nr:DUF4287 domain-containing protein [Parachlamydiaceae bacterium]